MVGNLRHLAGGKSSQRSGKRACACIHAGVGVGVFYCVSAYCGFVSFVFLLVYVFSLLLKNEFFLFVNLLFVWFLFLLVFS